MAITEQIQEDVKTAMKAGDKQRLTVLRVLVSELQKDAKEGAGDELAVDAQVDRLLGHQGLDRARLRARERGVEPGRERHAGLQPLADLVR